jgi:hypothetical protein
LLKMLVVIILKTYFAYKMGKKIEMYR